VQSLSGAPGSDQPLPSRHLAGAGLGAGAEVAARKQSPGKEALLIERFGRTSERDTVYLMSAAVPQPLLLRTLNSLAGLMKDRCGKELFLPAGPLPLWSGADGNAGVRPKEAFWKEIKALVEQTRLRVELIKKR